MSHQYSALVSPWWESIKVRRTRVIPALLLRKKGLVKSVKFKNHRYLGDPINIVKIFNEKKADELLLLDIDATVEQRRPDFVYLADITSEAFMPLCYGGGVREIQDIQSLLKVGIEKVCLNSVVATNPQLVKEAADEFGSSTIVVSVDVKKNLLGKYDVYTHAGTKKAKVGLADYVKQIEDMGAGEICINSIDKEGSMEGYDTKLIERVAALVNIPVIALGGAGKVNDFKAATDVGASAVSAGSMFVYHGKLRGILINMPSDADIQSIALP
jgi:imidazole glycerol-phosphate synthase subunit HisF